MRKAKPKKRYVLADPKFKDVTVTKFVNNMMYDGKKSIAYSIFPSFAHYNKLFRHFFFLGSLSDKQINIRFKEYMQNGSGKYGYLIFYLIF